MANIVYRQMPAPRELSQQIPEACPHPHPHSKTSIQLFI